MLHFPKAQVSRPLPGSPERRRVLIIGASPAGIATAYHLGVHSLLLERRNSLEDSHDHARDFPMGTADGSNLGADNPGADGYGSSVSAEEKAAVVIACNANGEQDEGGFTLTQVERWRPPDLTRAQSARSLRLPPTIRTLQPLLLGELQLNAHVVRVAPSSHLLELLDGRRFVYDKLVSTMSIAATERLVSNDLPRHVRRDESLRYWLSGQDIEVADSTMRDLYGDLDEFATGKRVAQQIAESLAEKFRGAGARARRGARLFEPRLVSGSCPSMP